MPSTSEKHTFQPAGPTNARAPCPALNSLANHGYINRDGRGITVPELIRAMKEAYHISVPLGSILAFGGTAVCGNGWSVNLDDLAEHDKIEHDASVVHDDARPTDKYAPTKPDPALLDRLLASRDGDYLTLDDFISSRIRREATLPEPLDGVHKFIAIGELALAQQIFEDAEGRMLKEHLRTWFGEERLPADWRIPEDKVVGVLSTKKVIQAIKAGIAEDEKAK